MAKLETWISVALVFAGLFAQTAALAQSRPEPPILVPDRDSSTVMDVAVENHIYYSPETRVARDSCLREVKKATETLILERLLHEGYRVDPLTLKVRLVQVQGIVLDDQAGSETFFYQGDIEARAGDGSYQPLRVEFNLSAQVQSRPEENPPNRARNGTYSRTMNRAVEASLKLDRSFGLLFYELAVKTNDAAVRRGVVSPKIILDGVFSQEDLQGFALTCTKELQPVQQRLNRNWREIDDRRKQLLNRP